MRLYPPIYPGESILHPGKLPGGDFDGVWAKAALLADFVRGNTTANDRPEFGVDVLAVEQQARAARNEWIAIQLKSYYAAIVRKLRR